MSNARNIANLPNGDDAPIYACRAWVNFDGTGTVAIRDSGNVSSITDNGTGDYTVNFTTAMPDENYCVVFGGSYISGSTSSSPGGLITEEAGGTRSTTQLQIASRRKDNGTNYDTDFINVAIFR